MPIDGEVRTFFSLRNPITGVFSMPASIVTVLGTRPEVIKMAPVIHALRAREVEVGILVTAQHRGLLDQMLEVFGLKADWDLDAMEPDQTLASLSGKLIPALDRVLQDAQPRAVLAQGDTVTVFCAALASFYRCIPFGHVEAGLRSGDMAAPFPEEGMRRLSAVLAHWHFAPTARAREALLGEGVRPSGIHVVGNTVIDALLEISERTDLPWPDIRPLREGERLLLVTLHRRENFGAPIRSVLSALATFARKYPEARLLYPVHPNPHVKGPAEEILGGLENVHLVEPLDYPTMVHALKRAYLVLTDSGGLQEEGPALGKPMLVCRDVTERPEAVDAGSALLLGTDPARILCELDRLWNDTNQYQSMSQPRFPYGDGRSAQRIAQILATIK